MFKTVWDCWLKVSVKLQDKASPKENILRERKQFQKLRKGVQEVVCISPAMVELLNSERKGIYDSSALSALFNINSGV
jgi:hypothetical protein